MAVGESGREDFLDRQLIYTGIIRAKAKLSLFANPRPSKPSKNVMSSQPQGCNSAIIEPAKPQLPKAAAYGHRA